jgi:hypothetical protein
MTPSIKRMKLNPSVPVIFTLRVELNDTDELDFFELDKCEQLRLLLHRLKVLEVAMQRVETLRSMAAKAPIQ